MTDDEKWMNLAIKQAIKAEKEGEVPIGAVLVKDELLIAKAHNQSITKNDATAHAEIQLLRNAGKKLQHYRLTGSTLYVTLEPCAMCAAAISEARIKKIYFGAYDEKKGAIENGIRIFSNKNYFKPVHKEDLFLILKFYSNK